MQCSLWGLKYERRKYVPTLSNLKTHTNESVKHLLFSLLSLASNLLNSDLIAMSRDVIFFCIHLTTFECKVIKVLTQSCIRRVARHCQISGFVLPGGFLVVRLRTAPTPSKGLSPKEKKVNLNVSIGLF